MEKVFIDTNILIYANDSRDRDKQQKAIQIISDLMLTGNGVISTQVMQEYANVALKKLNQDQSVVLRQLVLLESFEVIMVSPILIRKGIELKTVYNIGYWDSIIISAAESAKCKTIFSEDFNTGQYYSGIIAVNPLKD